MAVPEGLPPSSIRHGNAPMTPVRHETTLGRFISSCMMSLFHFLSWRTSVEVMLRSLGIAGVLGRVSGIAFGRFRGYNKDMRDRVHSTIQRVLETEFGLSNTPVVSGVDFGHTDPYFPIPVGIRTQIREEKVTLLETLTI